VRLAELPTQIEGIDEERLIVGVGFKNKETVCVDKQPKVEAPITVYTVVAVGVTIAALPVKALGFHVYDAAPFAVSVELKLGQTAVGEAAAVIVGLPLIINCTVEVELQPVVVPVTVYTVVLVGETTAALPVNALGFHVYEVAPFAVRVALKPIHTAVGDTAELTVGFGTTIKVIVLVPTHPAELVATTV
jgi:hypothetical protein